MTLTDNHRDTAEVPAFAAHLTPSTVVRLQRLATRADVLQETAQRAQQDYETARRTLLEAVTDVAEANDLSIGPNTQYQLDWKTGTLTLTEGSA